MPKNRVLVIDDDEDLLMVLQEIISHTYECDAFSNAKTALEKIVAGQIYDCIVCDLMMPQMGGIDFFKQLQNVAPQLLPKILVMSGGSYTTEGDHFLKTANVNYCEKPINMKKLLGLIKEIIF